MGEFRFERYPRTARVVDFVLRVVVLSGVTATVAVAMGWVR